MKIVVIGDSYTVEGFRLAGVAEGYTVEDPEDVVALVSRLGRRDDVSLIFLAEEFSEKVRNASPEAYQRQRPLLVNIPTTKRAETDYIRELLKGTMGVDLGSKQ